MWRQTKVSNPSVDACNIDDTDVWMERRMRMEKRRDECEGSH